MRVVIVKEDGDRDSRVADLLAEVKHCVRTGTLRYQGVTVVADPPLSKAPRATAPVSARYCVQCHRGDKETPMTKWAAVCDQCIAWNIENWKARPGEAGAAGMPAALAGAEDPASADCSEGDLP